MSGKRHTASARGRDAHYVLCVKENHPNLRDSILFADIDPRGPLTPSTSRRPYAVTGRWRIGFTAVWTCSSTRISHWMALSGVGLELVVVPAEQLHQLGVNEELLFAKRHFAQHAQGRKVVQVA